MDALFRCPHTFCHVVKLVCLLEHSVEVFKVVCVCVCVCVCACEHECMCVWQLLSVAYLQGGIKTGGLFTLGSSFRAKQPCLSVIQIGGFTTQTHTHTHKNTHTNIHSHTHTHTHSQTYRHSTASPYTPFPHISSHLSLLLR